MKKLSEMEILGMGLRAEFKAKKLQKKLNSTRAEMRRTTSELQAKIDESKKELRAAKAETTRALTRNSGSRKELKDLMAENEGLRGQVKHLEMLMKHRPVVRKTASTTKIEEPFRVVEAQA